MKIKTAEATGLQLDWGLAKVMGAKRIIVNWRGVRVEDEGFKVGDDCRGWVCHTDPAVCMGLIEQRGIASTRKTFSLGYFWECRVLDTGSESHYIVAHGKTLAEAAARLVVAKEAGEYFECPDELGVME